MITKVEGTSFLSAFCLQKYCFGQGNRLFSANYFILTRISLKQLRICIIVLYIFEVLEYAYRNYLPEKLKIFFSCTDKLGAVVIACFRVLPFILLGIEIAYKEKINIKRSICGFLISFILLCVEANKLLIDNQEKFAYLFMRLIVIYYFH